MRAGNVLRYAVLAAWLVFTLALTAWWAYFAFRQLNELARLDVEHIESISRYHRMLVWEGATLFLCLTGGAAWLAFLMHRETREKNRFQEFMAAFTHELKTPIASMKLQAEVLQEKIFDDSGRRKAAMLLADLERLNLRLENSLFLSARSNLKLLNEHIRLSALLDLVKMGWPSIELLRGGDCEIRGDSRAVEVIAGNILQNAAVHGNASQIRIEVKDSGSGLVRMEFTDNGRGYRGEPKLLGRLFARPSSESGSGIGLYLIKMLCGRMGGTAEFKPMDGGFQVALEIPGKAEHART